MRADLRAAAPFAGRVSANLTFRYRTETMAFFLIPCVSSVTLTENVTNDFVINIFPSFGTEGLVRTSLTMRAVNIGGHELIKHRHLPVSPVAVDRILSLEVNEEPQSVWSSLVTFMTSLGNMRLYLDARKMNSVTVKGAYLLPLFEGIFVVSKG